MLGTILATANAESDLRGVDMLMTRVYPIVDGNFKESVRAALRQQYKDAEAELARAVEQGLEKPDVCHVPHSIFVGPGVTDLEFVEVAVGPLGKKFAIKVPVEVRDGTMVPENSFALDISAGNLE